MQNAALRELGLDSEWSYEAIEVSPDDFEPLVRELAAGGEFAGVNVTVPHKVAALLVADESGDAAASIGAANTLTFRDGRIRADNTDAPGIVGALPRVPDGALCLVMGAGGSARAAVWGLRRAGGLVCVWNRTAINGELLAFTMGATPVADAWVRANTRGLGVLVNATTVGMEQANPAPDGAGDAAGLASLPVDGDSLGQVDVVIDLVYGPQETELIATARAAGTQVIDGLDVLVRQGAASFEIWTGRTAPIEAMREAVGS